MKTAGIIVEYNPLHWGHVHLLTEVRRRLGGDCAIVCVMSGDFVQRGDFALVRRAPRAAAAVESGADLVLELPLPWAVSSAERFADGGVATLLATGVITHLAFGSECGDGAALQEVAACLLSPACDAGLRRRLGGGMSYAACRQAAVSALLGPERGALLESPNNTLGIEYCKALLRHGSTVAPLTIPRLGPDHDAPEAEGGFASGSAIRALLRAGRREEALSLMAPAMKRAYLEEEAAGRGPVFPAASQRAILSQLRRMEREDFARLDQGREGLYNRLYEASRTAASLDEVLEAAKTKRYPHARLRRMVLWAYLGLTPGSFPSQPAYLRPLAANATGRALLARMRREASLPVLTKPADVRRLGHSAQALFALESRAADLYSLGFPDLSAALGGTLWKEGIALL